MSFPSKCFSPTYSEHLIIIHNNSTHIAHIHIIHHIHVHSHLHFFCSSWQAGCPRLFESNTSNLYIYIRINIYSYLYIYVRYRKHIYKRLLQNIQTPVSSSNNFYRSQMMGQYILPILLNIRGYSYSYIGVLI
jgi:hypothetical protein